MHLVATMNPLDLAADRISYFAPPVPIDGPVPVAH
jgi:hypothetical protein